MIESKYTIKDKGVEIAISDYSGERTYNITDRYYVTSFYTHENEHIDDLREIRHLFVQLGKHGCYLCAENLITDRYTEKEWKRIQKRPYGAPEDVEVSRRIDIWDMTKIFPDAVFDENDLKKTLDECIDECIRWKRLINSL